MACLSLYGLGSGLKEGKKEKEEKGKGKGTMSQSCSNTVCFPEEFDLKGLTFQTVSMQYILLLRV